MTAQNLQLVRVKEPMAAVQTMAGMTRMQVIQMEEPKQVVTTVVVVKQEAMRGITTMTAIMQATVLLVMVITAMEVVAVLSLLRLSKLKPRLQLRLHRVRPRQLILPEEMEGIEEAGSPMAPKAKVKEVDEKISSNNNSSRSKSNNSNSNGVAPSMLITHEANSGAGRM